MKKSSLFVLLCALIPVFSVAQSGNIVKQEIQLEPLTGVSLEFSGDIILTQGASQKIVMEGQQDVLDHINREVRDGVWRVKFDKSMRSHKQVTIYITMSTLKEVSLAGSGNISTTNTFTGLDKVEAAVAGSGNIKLSVQAHAVESAISGSGDITLDGSADTLEGAISGSGDLHADGLKTSDCEVAISGSGDASVYCTGSLETSVSGSGDVSYRGDAPKVISHISGSGDIRKID